jgi:sugar diacid utilization regulator
LGASIEGNVVNILRGLQHDIDGGRQEPPTAAVEYARRLAQRGVPVNALVRAYRLGQQFLLRHAFDASHGLDGAEAVRADANDVIVHNVFDYIDWISQRVVVVYEDERESWLANRSNARSAKVRQLLEGAPLGVAAAEKVIGYRLAAHHVAVVAWLPESRPQADQLSRSTRMVRAFAAEIGGGTPLVIGCDRATTWAWVPVRRGWTWDHLLARGCRGDAHSPVLALGGCQPGPEGFRRSHEQALQVQRLASLGGVRDRTLLSYDEPGVAATALLSQNVDIARAWIRDVLGDLARDDEAAARLRRTLLTFLRHDMNYTATAEAMVMHKNSIKYRLTSAEGALGHPVADDRLSVELALTACDWLGPAVLEPSGVVVPGQR